jgi:uncharacterized membrane protein HdeD (DUF308 family)
MTNFITYLRALLQPTSKDSVKSLAMLASIIQGLFLGLCLGVSLLIDVSKDGVLDSDLYGAAVFTVSIGALVSLSGIPKIITDKEKIKQFGNTMVNMGEAYAEDENGDRYNHQS